MSRTIGSIFTQRFAATVIAAALVCSFVATGCGSSSNTPADSGPTTCDFTALEALFAAKTCTSIGCHDSPTGAAGLDLKSAGLGARLLGMSPMANVGSIPSSCAGMGKVYLTPGSNPAMGLFIDKLTASPGCGTRMPQVGSPLNTSQMECVRSWALTVTNP
jgi:hypothetical protein